MMSVDILVLGAGSFARQTLYALSLLAVEPATVFIGSRDRDAAEEIATLCQMRSALRHSDIQFRACSLAWDVDRLTDTIGNLRPRIIVQTASLQSPWSLGLPGNAWNELVQKAGFGVTLPLQAALLVRLLRAVELSRVEPLVINACYPDWVNAAVRSVGYPVFCGLGNVQILESIIRLQNNLPRDKPLRVLAHHASIAEALQEAPSQCLPRILPGDVGSRVLSPPDLSILRTIRGRELNVLTGTLAASFLLQLLSNKHFCANVPGPLGLPGGYPVRCNGSTLSVDLPPSTSLQEAVRFNSEAGARDGVRVSADGTIEFSVEAAAALNRAGRDIPERFLARDLETIAASMSFLQQEP